MDERNEREVFDRAQSAKGELNVLEEYVASSAAKSHVKEIREHLEIIARRADPARHPDHDPGEGDLRPDF